MPTARDGLGVAAVGGMIYAAGGSGRTPLGSNGTLAMVEVYDPQTNTWATVAPMSTPRQYFGLAEERGRHTAADRRAPPRTTAHTRPPPRTTGSRGASQSVAARPTVPGTFL